MGQKNQNPNLQGRPFDELTVGDIMVSEVRFGYRQTKADQLASMMTEGDFGGVPILDDALRVIGIVTEFDLLSALDGGRKLSRPHSGTELSELSAEDIMSYKPVQVRPETDVLTLIYLFQRHHLIRVPVVDDQGRLVGMAARRDVLRAYRNTTVRPQAFPSDEDSQGFPIRRAG